MAVPLLDFLTGRAKQALPYLRRAAREGLTPSQALNSLKNLNLTFNRQRMLDVYAALQPKIDPERAVRLVGEKVPIPQELHVTAADDIRSNYQYVVGAFDEMGNRIGAVTVSSDVPLAGQSIRSTASLIFATSEDDSRIAKGANLAAISIEQAKVASRVPQS